LKVSEITGLGKEAKVKIRPKLTWAGTVDSYNVKSMERYPCYWAMRSLNICWDGMVVLCSVDYDAKFVSGNVGDESIESVWSKMKVLREAHLQERYKELPKFCQNCTDWQMARAEYQGGNS
jgi:radical SAM protein with 4Fe4S-binding SPASM domain